MYITPVYMREYCAYSRTEGWVALSGPNNTADTCALLYTRLDCTIVQWAGLVCALYCSIVHCNVLFCSLYCIALYCTFLLSALNNSALYYTFLLCVLYCAVQ